MSKSISLRKKAYYFLISSLPKPIRHEFYRRKFAKVPKTVPQGLTFELARTREDLEAAFMLLHDAYVEQGFIEPQPSGMRFIVQHALPTTSILVAKLNDRVVGTISVMRDTPLGLPMEKVFDISYLKTHGRRVAELSSLAIHPDFRRKLGGDIFFPLTLFAAMYAERSFGTDGLVWNLYPHHTDFYNAIFGSHNLKCGTKDYLGAPAAAIHLDLNDVKIFAKKHYAGLGPERDLYAYTYVTNHAYFKYPETNMGVINHPVMTPEIFKYFFIEKTNLVNHMTMLEEQVVGRYYPLPSYSNVLPFKHAPPKLLRGAERWDIRMPAECTSSSESVKALLLDISVTGFRAHLSKELPLNEVHCFEVKLTDGSVSKISAKIVWQSKDNVFGFSITKADDKWDQLVCTHADTLSKIAV